MKRFYNLLISMPFMATMLIVYAISMAVATFIENDFGAAVAKHLIYDAWWFELIQLILAINFIGNIFKYKLYKKGKWSILLFHVAFVFILLGAGITRYFGLEGSMHIREGESENKFLSEKSYLRINHTNGSDSSIVNDELFISPNIKNKYKTNFQSGKEYFEFEILKLIPHAEKGLKNDENGHPIMEIIIASELGSQSYYIDNNSRIKFQNQYFGLNLNSDKDSSVLFSIENNQLFVNLPFELAKMSMKGKIDSSLSAGQKHKLKPFQWYGFGNKKFVISAFYEKASMTYVEGKAERSNDLTILSCQIKSKGVSKEIFLPLLPGQAGEYVMARINNNAFLVSYGSVEIELPFSLKLNDFQLDRYPGSMSPSSFASEVILVDKEKNINKDFRIFMNNILEHHGYRFYQSSYDPDEKGTILSVNHDTAGIYISYFGYFILALGMVWALFSKNSHYAELGKKAAELRSKRKGLGTLMVVFLLFASQNIFGQDEIRSIEKSHANYFGKVLVQDNEGRIKPINTLNSELIRKISRKEFINGLNHNQVVMGMMFNPEYWQDQAIIKIGHPELMRMLGTDQKLVSFSQLVNMQTGKYFLKEYVSKAFEKQPGERNKFDKEVIAVAERVNLAYTIFSGQFLKIFPVPGDLQTRWLMPSEAKKVKDTEASKFISTIFVNYYMELVQAHKTKNWEEVGKSVDSLISYQKLHAQEILPSDTKVKLEIQYVNTDIFNRLYKFYGIVGFILLIILFAAVIRPKLKIVRISLILSILLALLFLFHTYGLGLRWYISGHAPWSNGYESMIYISWATMLAGFIFMKRSPIVLAATSLLAAITLMVAHLSWMDPQISNLVPVLKSYWLTIHVSVITASYGFLALGALLGLLNLILMIMKTSRNKLSIDITMDELTIVNHMTLIIGIYLLTIGTFLGAVWANESWGRYWGWDPKETWALISIIVYTFVLHSRLIPSWNNKYIFNLLSLLGFSSILMTYFGVNYYLSGLHSYAQGDPVPVPAFVYVLIAVVFVISLLAYFRNKLVDSQTDKLK